MKSCKVILACLMIVAVNAQRKGLLNFNDDSNSIDNNGNSGKRLARVIQNVVPQPPSFWDIFSPKSPATQEKTSITDQPKTFKDYFTTEFIQNALIRALRPKPIVDTATQAEKLAPNYGSGTQVLGDFLVKGGETISRAINTVIGVPKEAMIKLGKGATNALNQLGAYIVGL